MPEESSSEFSDRAATPRPEVQVFAHRGGWEKGKQQNSFSSAAESLTSLGGCEIDIGFTSDGVAVVNHDNVSKKTFSEYQAEYPDHGTLEDWIRWFEQPGMEGKQLYLDLKGTSQDPYELIKLVSGLGDRVTIGSKDHATVLKLLLARKLMGTKSAIYLQIPEPANPWVAAGMGDKLAATTGLEGLNPEDQELVSELRPDGLHFYWPESIIKDIRAEILKHGETVSLTDPLQDPDIDRFFNIPGFHNLQLLRLKTFVQQAKSRGYKVCAGSVASTKAMDRMIAWGVDAIMPNVARHSPIKEQTPTVIPRPERIGQHEIMLLDSGERDGQTTDQLKEKYLAITSHIKAKNVLGKLSSAVRQQLGF